VGVVTGAIAGLGATATGAEGAGATGRGATGAAAGAGVACFNAGGVAGRAGAGAAALTAVSFSSFSLLGLSTSTSLPPRIFLRTFSATSAGIELECVFFSVTP
jgi:hypothetical protein